jgi:Tol biopolymer transport system component
MARKRRGSVLGALGVLAATVAVPAAESLAKKGDAVLVSRQSEAAGGFAANGESNGMAISARGRFVAFDTEAANLGGPIVADENVYVYDRRRKRVQLVSRRSQAQGGAGGDADSSQPEVSASGRFIAFETRATDLGAAGGSNLDKVYVYDRRRQRVQLVSRRSKSAGGAIADGNTNGISISADGRFVSFRTAADNLGGPTNSGSNVYVYDRRKKRVQLVSRRSKARGGGGHNGTGIQTPGAISATGRFVSFTTNATNLAGAAIEGVVSCYVYDRGRRRVELVSRRSKSANGKAGNDDCSNPRLSASGRFVAMNSEATNLGGDPAVNKRKVYVYDRKLDRMRLVSRRARKGPAANAGAEIAGISGNGRIVGFTTDATNLGGPIQPGDYHSYVFDRKAGRARLVSRRGKSAGGGPANNDSFGGAPSGSGRYVAFLSNATNIGGPVVMAEQQVYVFDLLGP